MKHETTKKFAGLWIDHQEAQIICTPGASAIGDYNIVKKIKSHHHHDHGSNENVHQHTIRADKDKFYHEVMNELQAYDEVLIFGPGKAQEEIFNQINADKHFHSKKFSIDTAGNLTDNQVLAKVRDHFKDVVHSL